MSRHARTEAAGAILRAPGWLAYSPLSPHGKAPKGLDLLQISMDGRWVEVRPALFKRIAISIFAN
jgi:hypothetical protein